MTLAWLTGASRGIGYATALELARRNVELVLFGRSPEAPNLPVRVSTAPIDLANSEQLVNVCRAKLTELGTPDIVINNAGVIERAPVEQTSLESFQRQLTVNLTAPFIITREVLPAMKARGTGRIIHVGSISSTLGAANGAAYCASKWGLVGFMKSVAEELRNTGVCTVAVLPGSVDTNMLKGSGYAPRMSAEDVARTLVHYALDAPAAHNGSVIEMFGV